MLILNKSFQTIQKKAEEGLINAGINNNPGSIARLFLSIINSEMADFYETLSVAHMQCFVSTASDEYLDKIGVLLNCKREPKEEDDDYRYRITNQVLNLATSNETAVRLAALSVDGVDDVKSSLFSHGIGSYTLYLINKSRDISQDTLVAVSNAVSKVTGYGVKYTITTSTRREIDLELKLMFNNTTPQNIMDEVKIQTKQVVTNYINNLDIGEPFILNELTQLVMQQHDNILNYSILKFQIDKKDVIHTNQYVEPNEKFSVATSQRSIKVS